MTEASRREVRAGLQDCLARLWRYALCSRARVTSRTISCRRPVCARSNAPISSAEGTKLDRWLFSILRSIWLNEIRARRIREGGGFVDAAEALTFDGARQAETNILAAEVLKALKELPEAQRETVLLVYGEGYTYAEAAASLGVPVGTVMSRLATARVALAKLK